MEFYTLREKSQSARNNNKYRLNSAKSVNKEFKDIKSSQTLKIPLTERIPQSSNNLNKVFNNEYHYKTFNMDKNKILSYKKIQSEKNIATNFFNKTIQPKNELQSSINRKDLDKQILEHKFATIRRKQNKENFKFYDYKKGVKGKLQKLINTSLMFNSHNLPIKVKKSNKSEDKKFYNGLFEVKFNNIRLNKPIKKSEKNLNLNSKFDDEFITQDELIFKHFSNKEIEVIKSQPEFMKIRNQFLQDVTIFKSKNLVDVFREEERGINLNRLRHHASMTAKNPIKLIIKEKKEEIETFKKAEQEDKDITDILTNFKKYEKDSHSPKKNLKSSSNNVKAPLKLLRQVTINRMDRVFSSNERKENYVVNASNNRYIRKESMIVSNIKKNQDRNNQFDDSNINLFI